MLVAACATDAPRRSPRRRLLVDEDWIVVESANFEILSTLSREATVELAKELELFRAVVFATTNARRAPAPIPTKIFAFDSKRHYDRFAPSDTAGVFIPGLRWNTVLVSELRSERSALTVILHEYVHFVVLNGSTARYPVWYNEGFAEFLSAARRRDDVVVLGGVPQASVPALRSRYWLPLREVVEASAYDSIDGPADFMLYPQAWALVHYLTLGRTPEPGVMRRQLARYMELVGRGVAAADAFEAAFEEDLDALDDVIRVRLRNGEIPLVGLPIERLEFDRGEPTVREPGRSEIATRLGALVLRQGDPDQAGRYFAKAIEADPTNARARAGYGDHYKFTDRLDEAEPWFRRALELAPDDPWVMLDLAEFLDARAAEAPSRALARADQAEARALYRAVLELAPDLPEAHAMLGRNEALDAASRDSGIAHLERARELLPSSYQTALLLAEGYVARGEEARAVELLRRIQASRLPGTSAESVEARVSKMAAARDAARAKWQALPETAPAAPVEPASPDARSAPQAGPPGAPSRQPSIRTPSFLISPTSWTAPSSSSR